MKKRIFTFLVILCLITMLSSCAETPANTQFEHSDDNKNWSDYWNNGIFTGDVIPDEQSAKLIASVIFDTIPKNRTAKKYVITSVYFDSAENTWVVGFGEKQAPSEKDSPAMTGGGINIVLGKQDGKVHRIFAGE